MKHANGDEYSGEIRDDKREGWGDLTLNNGYTFRGMFKNDKLEGSVLFKQDK